MYRLTPNDFVEIETTLPEYNSVEMQELQDIAAAADDLLDFHSELESSSMLDMNTKFTYKTL